LPAFILFFIFLKKMNFEGVTHNWVMTVVVVVIMVVVTGGGNFGGGGGGC